MPFSLETVKINVLRQINQTCVSSNPLTEDDLIQSGKPIFNEAFRTTPLASRSALYRALSPHFHPDSALAQTSAETVAIRTYLANNPQNQNAWFKLLGDVRDFRYLADTILGFEGVKTFINSPTEYFATYQDFFAKANEEGSDERYELNRRIEESVLYDSERYYQPIRDMVNVISRFTNFVLITTGVSMLIATAIAIALAKHVYSFPKMIHTKLVNAMTDGLYDHLALVDTIREGMANVDGFDISSPDDDLLVAYKEYIRPKLIQKFIEENKIEPSPEDIEVMLENQLNDLITQNRNVSSAYHAYYAKLSRPLPEEGFLNQMASVLYRIALGVTAVPLLAIAAIEAFVSKMYAMLLLAELASLVIVKLTVTIGLNLPLYMVEGIGSLFCCKGAETAANSSEFECDEVTVPVGLNSNILFHQRPVIAVNAVNDVAELKINALD